MSRVVIPAVTDAVPPVIPAGPVETLRGETMGTTWAVTFPRPKQQSLMAIDDAVRACLDLVVAQMSTWAADSDLCRFNRAVAGSWHPLPPEFARVIGHALDLARRTGGAFDPTVGPAVDLWGFGPPGRTGSPPGEQAVSEAQAGIGWSRLQFDGARLFQPGGACLDLSAIAKGFAVDLVAEALAGLGLTSYLVEIGGELRGEGVKPDRSPWWAGLEQPPGEALPRTVVALFGLSIATSGDYRRFFEADGRRFAHTIDPRLGRPTGGDLASVTVLHRQCMAADALATALHVMGPEAGLRFARENHIAAHFIQRRDGRPVERLTPAFAAMVE